MSAPSWNTFLKHAKQQLADAQIEDPGEEARWLVRLVADVSSSDLILYADELIESTKLDLLKSALIRRVAHEPLQHIIGETEFYGVTLKSDKRALIPRPDSECVVELALEKLKPNQNHKIADLGSGSGALLIALLSQRLGTMGTAVERSQEASSLITENLTRHDLQSRATVFTDSWSDWIGWDDCDLIISNPPYIESAVIPTLASEVRDHDPMEALDGGPDGLGAYRELIALGSAQMKSGAWLVLEIGYDQLDAVSALLKTNGFIDPLHRKDLGGHDRAIAAKKP